MQLYHLHDLLIVDKTAYFRMYMWRLCIYVYVIFLLFSCNMCFREFSMLVEGHLVEWLVLAKCVTLLKYCVNKNK